MLFFVYEARAITGEKKGKLYVFSLSCALFFTGVASFPAIIACLSGDLGKYFISVNYIAFDILFAVLFIYYATRAVTLMITADKTDACETESFEQNEEFCEHKEYDESDDICEEETDTAKDETSEASEPTTGNND